MTTPKPSTALGWQIVAVLALVLIAVTLVALFTSKDEAAFLTPVIGLAGVGITQLVSARKVDETNRQVKYLANGGTDAKNRVSLVDVLKPEVVREEYREGQEAADRAHIEAGPQ